MNIIYLHQYFIHPHQPGGTRSYDLATEFSKAGHSVDIISMTSAEEYKDSTRWMVVKGDGIVVHYIYLPYGNHLSYFKRLVVFFKYLWFSSFRVLYLRADVVLASSTPLTVGIPALIKKFLQKTPYIFETRDVWPEAAIAIGAINNKYLQMLLFVIEKVIYKNASIIIPLSLDMQRSIITRYPLLKNKKVQVIENISSIDRFRNIPSMINNSIIESRIGFKPRFTVLYAGAFGRVNGINYVLELAEQTYSMDKSLIYILLGVGGKRDEIINLARNKKILNKNVFFFDQVPKQDLPLWYYEADMGSSFVIPVQELWANSANKYFDTLAAGKPILINYGGWQKSEIETENIGYVLPPSLKQSDITKFIKYTRSKKLIESQKINALNIAINKYCLTCAVNKYLVILDKFESIVLENNFVKIK